MRDGWINWTKGGKGQREGRRKVDGGGEGQREGWRGGR